MSRNKVSRLVEVFRAHEDHGLEAALSAVVDEANRTDDVQVVLTPVTIRAARAMIATVCKEHGLTVQRVLGPDRDRWSLAARYECYARLRAMNISLVDVGALMGGRGHDTVIHGLKRMAAGLAVAA